MLISKQSFVKFNFGNFAIVFDLHSLGQGTGLPFFLSVSFQVLHFFILSGFLVQTQNPKRLD